jgi:hypothetical protein
MKVLKYFLRGLTVIASIVIGTLAASQAGWSGGDATVNLLLVGPIELQIAWLLFCVSLGVAWMCVYLVYRYSRRSLWLQIPLMTYAALVLGLWNGYMSDFDGVRAEALRHRTKPANAYELQHMNKRGLYRTCNGSEIDLTGDALKYCEEKLSVKSGDKVPGSEHLCGSLVEGILKGMTGTVCYEYAP